MGLRLSTISPVIPEGLGYVIYEGMNGEAHQISSSLHSQRGGKTVNQDAAVLCQGYGLEDGVLCGVFDGHGEYGHKVSKIVRERLPVLLLAQMNAVTDAGMELYESFSENQETTNYDDLPSKRKNLVWQKACVNAFEKMDEEIKLTRKLDSSFSGTTAVVVLKQGEDLLVANLGDSRAVLGTKRKDGVAAVPLTTDLKPNLPGEADRIRRSNGRVFALKEEPGVARAWMPRVYCPGMAMSRSFGDFVMKKHGILSTPVVTHHHITSDDLFIVLATDGVWDVLSNEEVVSIVQSAETETVAARAVVEAAVAVWKTKFPKDKPDDCTAVCLFLHQDLA